MKLFHFCFYSLIVLLMNPFEAVLVSTNWWFVVACTVWSFALGALRYNKSVFGTLYGRWMRFPENYMDTNADWTQDSMAASFILEFVSRFIFFIWVQQFYLATWWGEIGNGLIAALLLRFFFVFSTQLSYVSRALVDKKVVFIIWGKMLLDLVLATLCWYYLVG